MELRRNQFKKKVLSLNISISAPKIMIPEKFTRTHTSILVLDFGSLHVLTSKNCR